MVFFAIPAQAGIQLCGAVSAAVRYAGLLMAGFPSARE
jgi:hypothetical protein